MVENNSWGGNLGFQDNIITDIVACYEMVAIILSWVTIFT